MAELGEEVGGAAAHDPPAQYDHPAGPTPRPAHVCNAASTSLAVYQWTCDIGTRVIYQLIISTEQIGDFFFTKVLSKLVRITDNSLSNDVACSFFLLQLNCNNVEMCEEVGRG